MTSRDLTENVEQYQIRQSLELVRARVVTVLARLGELAVRYCELPMVGRSHNTPDAFFGPWLFLHTQTILERRNSIGNVVQYRYESRVASGASIG